MKKSDILRKARTLIETKQSDYVCYAIGAASTGNSKTCAQGDKLTEWVMELLGEYPTLGGWLYWRRVEGIGQASCTNGKIRVTRLAWLDWMIQYWEAKGD